MASLRIVDNELLVEHVRDEHLDEGEASIFFKLSLISQPVVQPSVYRYADAQYIPRLIVDIHAYLLKHEIDCELDDQTEQLLASFNAESHILSEAARIGSEIKTRPLGRFSAAESFSRKLKRFQVQSANHMFQVPHSANFSVPGSGKTTIVYAAYSRLLEEDKIDLMMIIGPRSSFMPWEDEFQECFGCKPQILRIVGSKRERQFLYKKASRKDIIITTYNSAARDTREVRSLLSKRRTFLVLDESHYIKRLFGGTWSEAMLSIARFARKRAILTGTPMPNSLEDLWNQFEFLWPDRELLGTRDFLHHYGQSELDHVKSQVMPFFVRIKKSDLRLPPPALRITRLPMQPYQRKIYEAVRDGIRSELRMASKEKRELRSWRRARLIRLMQVASNPTLVAKYSQEFDIPPIPASNRSTVQLIREYPRYETPSKVLQLDVLLERLIGRREQKVIVWTNFIHNIRTFSRRYKHHRPLCIFGEIARDEREDEEHNREKYLRLFKYDKRFNLLIANPATCAESVSLHKVCRHAVYFDRTFNCGQFLQSMDRIHRVGLTSRDRVYFHFLISADSVDEVIHNRLEIKAERMMRVLDDELPIFSYYVDETLSGDVEDDGDLMAFLSHIETK